MDILRFMKDSIGGAFDPDVLIGHITGFYAQDRELEVSSQSQKAIDVLKNIGLVYSIPESDHPNVLHISVAGYREMQCTLEDDFLIRQRHFSGLVSALRGELRTIRGSDLREWQDSAHQVISDYVGPELASKIQLQALNTEWWDYDECLENIRKEYSCAKPTSFNARPAAGEIALRIQKIALKWDGFTYRGRRILEPSLMHWLEQFTDDEKPFMLRLLEFFLPISASQARDLMTLFHWRIEQSLQKMRPNLLVSAFGSPSKSGSTYARMFQQERKESVWSASFDQLVGHLSNADYDGLVFVDDVIGSGANATELLEDLNIAAGPQLTKTGQHVFLCAMVATEAGLDFVRDRAVRMPFPVEVLHFYTMNKCFDSEAKLFDTDENNEVAKKIAAEKGGKVFADEPLGFRDGQMLVALFDNCPDNTLPIFASVPDHNSELKHWVPLFPRI